MRELSHREACPLCVGELLFQHCNACHRLFLHCRACEAEHPDARQPSAAPGTPLPPDEHPTCPRCLGTLVRPATRSDLENRDLMAYLASPERP